jgi:hypothetical protein
MGSAAQLVFDANAQCAVRFENLVNVRKNVTVIYDPSDELVAFRSSAYLGVLYIFRKLQKKIMGGKAKLKTKYKTGAFWRLVQFPGYFSRTRRDL